MKTNFAFLEKEFRILYTFCLKAEKNAFIEPSISLWSCRVVLEKALYWLYQNDEDLQLPHQSHLAGLLYTDDFKDIVKPSMFEELMLIHKLGNRATHGKKVTAMEALQGLKNIFRFTSWISKYYSKSNPDIPAFDERLIPYDTPKDTAPLHLQRLENELEESRKKEAEILKRQEQLQRENEVLKQQHEAAIKAITERKQERQKAYENTEVVPELTSEKETRRLLIDLMLKEAGWQTETFSKIAHKNTAQAMMTTEYEVANMPTSTNPSGKGYVDYVLWDANGKPLAVIEAKKALHDASKGKHQAMLYADALERQFRQRPIIFYTNGYSTYLWDDAFYPPRKVSGFYTLEELQTLIRRRTERKDLRQFTVDKNIAGRPYQLQAIQRIAETMVGDAQGKLRGKNRKALLVMATGSGKTRTAAAMVDMFTKCNWAKRILFLTDRNALVTQAKNAFKEHLPQLSAIDLTKDKEDDTARVVFSTYPTILNRIDQIKNEDERLFGIGHFDVIIIDEAHRSVYQKYQAIFDYFDAILIGLTATPVKHVDRNTYHLFEIEDDNPTFAYELNTAVSEGFLVPPKAISVPVKYAREGIKYKELSEKAKAQVETIFGIDSETEDFEISKSQMNSQLFNTHTVDLVLSYLMEHGLKVASGDRLGKTIIFAKNHRHAVFIEERFNKMYPEWGGSFLRVIDNYADKAQDLLDRFKDDKGEDKDPQIAVSVDMMDTGVDAPRVLNLVFFKEVKSYAKYWQMIGRGTRKCPNIFGVGKDKEFFLIFDICGNFEYFDEYPDGFEGSQRFSLQQRLFQLQSDIIYHIQQNANATDAMQQLAKDYKQELHAKVCLLDESKFEVRRVWEFVRKYKDFKNWETFSLNTLMELHTHLSPIVFDTEDTDEMAKQFDLMIYQLELALLTDDKKQERSILNLMEIGSLLNLKLNIPSVKQKEGWVKKLIQEDFWATVQIDDLEKVRSELRGLHKLLKDETTQTQHIYATIDDELNPDEVREVDLLENYTQLQSYKDRVEHFIRKNKNHIVIDKLYRNIPITPSELESLEKFLTHEQFDVDKIEQEYETKSLGVFVRKVLGLDIQAAQQHFAQFIEEENLNANQMLFVQKIIDYLNKNGVLDKTMLTRPPFTDQSDEGVLGVFEDTSKAMKIIHLIDEISLNAGIA